MIRSHTLFRTLTLVGITIFTFILSVSTIVSGLSAQAESKVDSPNQRTALQTNQPNMSFGVTKSYGIHKPQDKLSLLAAEDNQLLKPQSVDTATDRKTENTTTETSREEKSTKETPKELHKKAQRRAQSSGGDTPVMTAQDKQEILWLARIIYSETKRPNEQRLIAWVVRNRVDTGYTGRTYESVANHASQFSGLHPYDSRYEHNMSRFWASQGKSWRSALRIAKSVYFAPESERPFAKTTRHFYSPISVYDKPAWAYGREAVRVIESRRHPEPRFAFYSRVR
jgi:hypothetical protein